MHAASRTVGRPHRGPVVRCTTARRRSADVLGVYDTVADAHHAAAILAHAGIGQTRIALVVPGLGDVARPPRRRADAPPIVLLRGELRDVDRAHEILADEAARAYHDGARRAA